MSVNGQTCPRLTSPTNGSTNVPVNTTITWNNVDGATGYIINIGTFSGGGDLISTQTGTNFYTPPLGLPDNTEIFVTITLFFFDQPDVVCQTESFFTEDITTAPNCTNLIRPSNGAVNINVGANISWNYAIGATGYFISVGTTSGSGDLINNLDVGNVLQYNPAIDLPPLTEIFVNLIPYNENGNQTSCSEESFITGTLAALPICSPLIYPVNGQTNVPLSPFIEWEASLGATGYKVYIGSSPFENDILDEGIFFTNSTFVLNFESNSLYFIRVIPFNDSGDALGCTQSSFSTILGCGPFFDIDTGELTTLNPDINFPDVVEVCLDQNSTIISSSDDADGYRWYAIDANGDEVLISEESQVSINESGNYIYEAFNFPDNENLDTECSSFKTFNVIATNGLITIDNVEVSQVSGGLEILINVSGNGNYEYSVISENGPFQDSNFFDNAPIDTRNIYVRNKNGCGKAEYRIRELNLDIFPRFFTPNADGFNDVWQYKPQSNHDFTIESIFIYNQYGKLIKQISPNGEGWNGTMNGELLPDSDYWYYAKDSNGKIYKGHFALRR
ncbi:T9SS type B sorting domain-containing protein [Flaviramulus sp. BrNp1-15]|uniref:T9SS type B sorting domain-containing protein n=1 Tax=Flaviramulus sp. BrNp1-15 TaxID=2916754 RepID=UPI001EE863D3|nr:T9SS type B sorting domain-containing protein [Flaviramulus sp. BrNp1-15]ULC59074.1 T9SS type B sorting domain-containing protein [Flaviramulus sp. BrNp1-15]